MLQGILSLLLFAGILAGVGFGASYLVDHRAEVFGGKKEGASIMELRDAAVESAEEAVGMMEESVSETMEASVEKSSVDILVLNGGAEVGAAGDLADALKQSGYEKAEAGNASEYTYSGVTVYFSSESEAAAGAVAADIASVSGYESTSAETEEATQTDHKRADVVVIVGE